MRAAFRLPALRDPLELLSGLKWPVDALVAGGWLAGDGPGQLLSTPLPQQSIDRARRGILLIITLAEE